MNHEESEPTFEVQLEQCVMHGSLDELTDFLRDSGAGDVSMLEKAIDQFDETDSSNLVVVSRVLCIVEPKVLGRCLYEFEKRDSVRATGVLNALFDGASPNIDLEEAIETLRRLRENGGDGGAGDREPLRPIDPRDADSIALDIPEQSDTGAVGILDRPSGEVT